VSLMYNFPTELTEEQERILKSYVETLKNWGDINGNG
jgi:hypothetical protein